MTLFYRILLAVIVALVVPDAVIWGCFLRDTHSPWRWSYWLLTALTVLPFVLMITRNALVNRRGHADLIRWTFSVFLFIVIPKWMFTLTAPWLGWVSGAVMAAVSVAAFAYGFIAGWKQLTVRRVTMSSSRIPLAFDSYTIAQLSDLHVGSFAQSPDFVCRVVDRVTALAPDLIVFTGDLVNVQLNEVESFVPALSSLNAPDGVYSILGNHDYGMYRGHADQLARVEQDMGWHVLRNEHITLRRGDEAIALAGVDNTSKPPFPSFGNLQQALQGIDDDLFTILLSHDPWHWRGEVLPQSKVDLTLAGHTHGGQLSILGLSPARIMYGDYSGVYRQGDRAMIVSNGLGGRLRFRLGAWPEITLITLRHASSVD